MTAMALAQLRELEATRVATASVAAYWAKPTYTCGFCGLELSGAVATLHGQRTGHRTYREGAAA